MVCELYFNPERDIQAVEQTGYVDLAKANSMNSIPANIDGSDLSYNRIEDPNSIAGRPSDVFESYQASKVYEDYAAENSKTE